MESDNSRSTRQLEFIAVSKEHEIVVGASNIVNSGDWNGDLIYFANDEEIPFEKDVYISEKGIKHYLPISVCDGTFIDEKKVVVGNDCGMLAMYSVSIGESTSSEKEDTFTESCRDSKHLSFYNNVCCVDHDRSILSLSVSQDNRKIVTGSMDHNIKIWDVESFIVDTTYTSAHAHHVTSVRYKRDPNNIEEGDKPINNVFLSTSLDGFCQLWDSRQQYPAQVISKNPRSGYTTAEWFDSNHVFLGCEDGILSLCDIRNTIPDNQRNYQFFNKHINKIALLDRNSEKYFAVSEDSRTLKVLQYKDDNFIEIYSNSAHKDVVKGLAWNDATKEAILLSCSWDSRIIRHLPFNV